MNNLIKIFVIILLQEFCCGQFSRISEISIGQNVGAFSGINSSITSYEISFNNYARYNEARTTNDVANAGYRLFASGDTNISDSLISLYGLSYDNFAQTRRNTAVAGSQTVLADISDSEVSKATVASRNEARIIGSSNTPVPQAIAGSQTQVRSFENSTFVQENIVLYNVAFNAAGGNSLAGSETSFGKIDNSSIFSEDLAKYNYASNFDGPATSGVEFGTQNVQNSSVTLQSFSQDNDAFSIDGSAVAGAQQNFGTVNDSYIYIEANSKNNFAYAYNGEAISGVVSAFETVENSTIKIDVDAHNNYAYSYGESDTPKNSVSGASITVNSLENSQLNITANTTNNNAINTIFSNSNNNDAISGVDIVVGQAQNSEINVDLSSKNNSAYAVYGDAVTGNRVQVLSSENTSVNYYGNYTAGNYGTSIFGSIFNK